LFDGLALNWGKLKLRVETHSWSLIPARHGPQRISLGVLIGRKENLMRNEVFDDTRRSRGIGSILTGFVIGGLIGAAAALLMAPQSGEEMRAMIRDRSVELKEKAVRTVEDTRNRAEEAIHDTVSKAEEMARTAKDRTEDMVKRGQKGVENQASQL
jgi:gas vesicle protein